MLFWVLLFVLPFQFGKHFWPSFAFVAGQRVDYLSPTLYVSDVLVALLFLVMLFQKRLVFGKRWRVPVLVSFLYLSIGISLSQSPLDGWYALLKLLECLFVVWFVAREAVNIQKLLAWAFGTGIVLEGILAVLQFFHQRSLGGLWYFLGERSFSASTPGIANASIHGQLVLRPYATFPHPNVLAGYFVIALLFFLLQLFAAGSLRRKLFLGALMLFGGSILLLTLSRVAIGVFVLLAFFFLLFQLPKRRGWIALSFLLLVFSLLLGSATLSERFLAESSYTQAIFLRDVLMQAAWWMVVSHPLLGVGLGNFLPSLPRYLSSGIIFGFLQPVHSIFLLVLTETGILGLIGFLYCLVLAFAESFKKLKAKGAAFPFLALCAICLIGLTDHYFLTLQQGQLLFAVVLGLSYRHGTIALWPFTANLPRTRSTR